ncbi:D-glycero-alpha-D-manno-heptose-1,7-bisphosphate 7-phosphatase [Bacillus sp. KH172YL63]|uniref:D-glycero-alpha-D-manno-heptose-1,7-bisphosphate 7-phosphatase n=1 Tax=Bacillus sp. KH172YL63 TaxID=2709784 RepID=UPI0013E45BEB|nr:HAD family hydrolase [Bacillus sp. KH172YL63]BCB03882.1 histidinol phosphate phosphatase [Bacillus sp. KH172YL63]
MKKAIFLDRDGVINEVKSERVKFVNKPSQFYFLEGVTEAVKKLSQSGFLLYVVTNQGGVGLGYLTKGELDRIHDHMVAEIEKAGGRIEEVSCCIHKPKEGCSCRKPEAGMIVALAEKHGLDLNQSYMIGDRDVDIEAGRKAGCKTILLAHHSSPQYGANHIFPSLKEASEYILSSQ